MGLHGFPLVLSVPAPSPISHYPYVPAPQMLLVHVVRIIGVGSNHLGQPADGQPEQVKFSCRVLTRRGGEDAAVVVLKY